MKFLVAAAGAIALFAAVALADSPLPLETKDYLSSDRTYKLTVVPRSLQKPGPGSHGREPQCLGVLHKLEDDEYRQVWRMPLVNDEAPARALVAERTGYVVTFDNWFQLGYGDDVVAIYTPRGTLVRQLALTDFLTADEIESLPRSVSSILWGGEHRFSSDEEHVEMQVATRSWWRSTRSISIRLADGKVED